MNSGGYWSWYQHTAKICVRSWKKSLQGTSNSHNPLLTRTSAQSEAALKVRGDVYTYINHERSHHKKNSNAHKRHSASVCKHFYFSLPHRGIYQIFLLGLLAVYFSWFTSCLNPQASCFCFLFTVYLSLFSIKPLWKISPLARRSKTLT